MQMLEIILAGATLPTAASLLKIFIDRYEYRATKRAIAGLRLEIDHLNNDVDRLGA